MADASPMSFARPLAISAALIAAMAGMAVYGWIALPAGAQIPVHWGLDGLPDRYAGKAVGLGLMPVLALVVTLLMVLVPRIEPRRAHLSQSGRAYAAIWIALIGLFAMLQAGIVAAATGIDIAMSTLVGVAVGILFMVVGNYLAKVRSNFMLGIRTPWTLSSERVWDRTHRTAGPVFVVLGLAVCVVAILLPPRPFFFALIAAVLAATVFAVAWSYVLWRRERDGAAGIG